MQGSPHEGLAEAWLLELRWRSGGWGGLEEVLGQLRAEEGHLRKTVPCGDRSWSWSWCLSQPSSCLRYGCYSRSQEALLLQLQPLLQGAVPLHLRTETKKDKALQRSL